MELIAIAAALIVLLAGGALQFWFARRYTAGWSVGKRPIKAFQALHGMNDRAVESGRGIHMSLGRADLGGPGNPATIAALEALDGLAEAGALSDSAPLTTVGDGALLLAAQDSLRGAHRRAGRALVYQPDMAHFVAGKDFAMSYAAGVSEAINQGELGSNVLLGRFGSEVVIMAEAGERGGLEQIIGSDDPQAMAIAAAVTDNALVGEELFAAGAYLLPQPAFLAGLQLIDVLRAVAIVILLLAALLDFIL